MMKIGRLVLVALWLLTMAGLGTSTAQAAGICVHPSGAGKCFSSIQAAVDAANDGERISIRPGKYVEQISILGKNLTLVGQSGVVIQAPHGMQDTLSAVGGVEGRPIILVAGADVTLRNLTIDGANSAAENPFLDGITFVSAGGVIRENLIRNVGFGAPTLPLTEGGPSYQGNGIVVANLDAAPRSILISDNRLVRFNSVGITVFAETDPANPAVSTLNADILNNVVVAQGPNNVIDQWGIFLGGYNFADPQSSVTGAIRGNKISDALTTSPENLPGVGIVTLFTHDVEVSDNTIENVNVGHAANLAFTGQIHNNLVTGRQVGIGSTGFVISGSDTTVTENRFKKLDVGILLMVDDANFGSAVNTSLHENQFDHVGLDLLTGAAPAPAVTLSAKAILAAPRFGPR